MQIKDDAENQYIFSSPKENPLYRKDIMFHWLIVTVKYLSWHLSFGLIASHIFSKQMDMIKVVSWVILMGYWKTALKALIGSKAQKKKEKKSRIGHCHSLFKLVCHWYLWGGRVFRGFAFPEIISLTASHMTNDYEGAMCLKLLICCPWFWSKFCLLDLYSYF